MEFLKWIAAVLVAVIGLCALGAIVAFLWAFGAIIGTVFLGLFVIWLAAVGIKEYFDSRKT